MTSLIEEDAPRVKEAVAGESRTRSFSVPGESSKPRHPDAHVFQTGDGAALLNVEESRIFELEPSLAGDLELCLAFGDTGRASALMGVAGLKGTTPEPAAPPKSVPVKAISLAIAQKCNLGCTYCYARQGSFGGAPKNMPLDVAKAAIDGLFKDVPAGELLTVVFLGGEPLANRAALRAATEYAVEKAIESGVGVRFSLTTNATLIQPEDVEFFDRYGFAITVSIDGIGEDHDRQRPLKSGRGSFERVVGGVKALLGRPGRKTHVNARVTVTPQNLHFKTTLTELSAMGFDGVHFAPMMASPTGEGQMNAQTLETMLTQMIDCGKMFEAQFARGSHVPFSNLLSTLKRIHEGAGDDYPCGAGGGYLGVSSEGKLYACHRFVDDEEGLMGDVATGPDPAVRSEWLASRNVRNQPPCQTCWARRLCGGSCHYEVMKGGRQACDYIRGWLHYCLGAYVRLSKCEPNRLHALLTESSRR